ncbi:hypothetical protein [Actinomadura chibensis]|uniref:Zf-HC2 domain-containing protein n=1 Tax=Actinomadura chibensis TaxID=392828 RepID=A0A5D0NN29_9ACTN|nr:hypothetical protein [Actinomadura chibensis]TYB45534.1 hypothetical protein FXF69_19070 [Actinomadura chibensis]
MSTWHCDAALLRRYTAGETDLVASASIEAHLVRCAGCRAGVAALADPDPLERVWTGVRETIQRPRLPLALRLLRRAGLSAEDAALLAASRSLRGPWTLATVAVLVFAVAASWPGAVLGTALYLLVAPLVPVLGVVAAFTATDPLVELTNATPYSKTRLALLRTVAVIATTVPLVTVMGAVAGIGWLAVAWLTPALGLTLAALVALTWWPPPVVGGAVSGLWVAVVAAAYLRDDLDDAVRPTAQICYLVLAAITVAVLAARIRAARTPGGYA